MKDKTIKEEKKIDVKDFSKEKISKAIKSFHKEETTPTSPQQYSPFLYLYGAMSQPEITSLVRGQCIQGDIDNLGTTISNWRNATKLFRQIEQREQGIADNNPPHDIASNPKLAKIEQDPLFKNTFANYPIELKMVEIDNMVAPQRNVSLDYVENITQRIPESPSLDDLIDICLSPKQNVPKPKSLQQSPNMLSFSSPSVDFRFLGGYLKSQLTDDDLKYTTIGGLPVTAITMFVGYGAGSVNVYSANNRLVLNNGFHRVFALRKRGITKIPVVVQHVGNVDLEFPPALLGLSKDYLLKNSRPVLVKDFFVDDLTTVFKKKKTVRNVRVNWAFEQSDMAV